MAAQQPMPGFRARMPWWGGDLQTIRNTVLRIETVLPEPARRLLLPLSDASGDQLAARLDLPPEKANNEPLVVLIHGLTGCEDSAYMRTSSAFHLRRGRNVLRLNLRGSGPSRQWCAGHYHAGCSRDIRDGLLGLDKDLMASGMVVIGYSLGGNVLLNLLARHCGGLPIICAATVSAPIEPSQASQRLMEWRNKFYHDWLLRQMKAEAMADGACISEDERIAIQTARTIWDYDDGFVAPRFGFAGAEDYYERVAGARLTGDIGVSTLMIHATNDPWIPAVPYAALETGSPGNVKISLSPGGGHVGFHAAGHKETWHDRHIDAFMKEKLCQ